MGLSTLAASLIFAAGSPAVLCVVGSHLLIRLKEAAERGLNEGTTYRANISAVDFDLSLSSEESMSGTLTNLVSMH